ncbi:MAG: hypothetical protein LBI10_00025 [Deltaproteobacteria bacterium]|jgi:flagellar biosynthesis protein FlhF|nr:hypothetical protein [Deltaproteobacteria bacterium]
MRIKRFTAPTMPEVVELIKAEFGLGAVILSQRENPDSGYMEVTVGAREEDLPKKPLSSPLDPLSGSGEGGTSLGPISPSLSQPVALGTPKESGLRAYRKVMAGEAKSPAPAALEAPKVVAELKTAIDKGVFEIRELILDLAHRRGLADKWRERSDLVALYRELLATSLDADLARDLVEKAAESQAAWGGDLISWLKQTARPLIKCREPKSPDPKIIALIGPSGAGKTTILVKLAALAQKKGQKVAAITLDTLKLGALSQLTQYARILGLGVKACQSRAELLEAKEIFDDANLILVDTSSRDFGPEKSPSLLADLGAKTLLVLSASLKTEDLTAFYARSLGPDLLAVALTKLDETQTLGGPLSFILKQGPILGYFSQGPVIPEDIMAAAPDRLLDWWLTRPENFRKG